MAVTDEQFKAAALAYQKYDKNFHWDGLCAAIKAALSLPVSNTDIDRTSEPKGHWEDGGKVWVEDHDCSKRLYGTVGCECCVDGLQADGETPCPHCAPPVSKAEEWQPIETAPKDGTAILAFNCRHMSHAPVVVVWRKISVLEEDSDPHWADAATRQGTALYYNGNYFSHWQPLPEPPL
jgi:hypothetical protein